VEKSVEDFGGDGGWAAVVELAVERVCIGGCVDGRCAVRCFAVVVGKGLPMRKIWLAGVVLAVECVVLAWLIGVHVVQWLGVLAAR
jgi:hypothetical protein